ncbi:hypothetical protein BN165_1710006 [Clostridioides difficile E1]|nr:hypothetical protein BN163_1210006 [Clostridioides difficile T5]CCK95697.1 hypothetical protein BN165_1710006 [Clostridioides difficile E1]CCK98469.1 hypothetical protein BN166_1460006 [Clostridioides difficile E10]
MSNNRYLNRHQKIEDIKGYRIKINDIT